MIYRGPWHLAPWDGARWPALDPKRIACRCCGETVILPNVLDSLQDMAALSPLVITSAHRCAIHNAQVGGAPLSMHKRLAFDIALKGHDPAALLARARAAGFTGFGFGQTFLHIDRRARPTSWFYGKRSIEKWTSVLSSIPA